MSKTFLWFTGWTWLDIVSLAMVFAGVTFGFILECRKSPVKPNKDGLIPVGLFSEKEKLESHRKLWLHFWEVLLIMGLAGELIAAFHNIPEIARLTNENLKLEGEVSMVNTNMQSGFANLAPTNQPITSVEASVHFFVAGTNLDIFDKRALETLREEAKYESPEQFFEDGTDLSFAVANTNLPEFGHNFPIWLHCNKFETSLGRETIIVGGENVISFDLEFGPTSPSSQNTESLDLRSWQGFTVGNFENNNVVYLHISFFREGIKTITGTCILKINQTAKTFSIWRPPQTLDMYDMTFVADMPPATNFYK